MRPGHFAPDIAMELWAKRKGYAASMRPGHFAPDIRIIEEEIDMHTIGFNEAGAFCPGYCFAGLLHRGLRESFNEAGAFCPGYCRLMRLKYCKS